MTKSKSQVLKEELIDLVDEYFPKIKPLGGNKGRGKAMVLMVRALILFEFSLTQQKSEMLKTISDKLFSLQDEFDNRYSLDLWNALDDVIEQLK
jgi:hypothetical protein